jgi:hypothetical protein
MDAKYDYPISQQRSLYDDHRSSSDCSRLVKVVKRQSISLVGENPFHSGYGLSVCLFFKNQQRACA